MLSFLICNNVYIIENSGRNIQAASQDEIAFVKFAEKNGYLIKNRSSSEIIV